MKKTMTKWFAAILTAAIIITATVMLSAVPATAASEVWDGSIAGAFAGGNGTIGSPYLISTGAELAYLAQRVNAGSNYNGMYFLLTDDIVLNDTTNWESWETTPPVNTWTPIGSSSSRSFRGFLDGAGHTVSGIYVNVTTSYTGLFGYIYSSRISNVGIVRSYIKG